MPTPTHSRRPTALITGATRGIGHTITQTLAPTHDLILGGRTTSTVCEVARVFNARPFPVDLTDEVAVERELEGLESLDLLIHCAGVVPPRHGSTRERLRSTFEVNVVAAMDITERLLPLLRASRGTVVFINSGAGLTAHGTDGYSASKFALTAYADGLRHEERGRVRVISVHPGRVDTDMQKDLQERMGAPYQPEAYLHPRDVADAVRAAVEAPFHAGWETVIVRPQVS